MIALLALGGLLITVVVAAAVHGAGTARARALADDVRDRIEPYLRRKAAEAGLSADHDPWTSRTTPEEIVEHSAHVADKLLDRERQSAGGGMSGQTTDVALAKTQRVPDRD